MSLLYVFSDCLYLLVGKVVKYRHKVIWKNLKDSFPEKDEAELQRIECEFYHYFCDYLVETIKLLNMSKRELRQRMVFTGIEEMNELLEKGVSCAVYLGHYGNWELITSLPLWVSGEGTVLPSLSSVEERNDLINSSSLYAKNIMHFVFQWQRHCDKLFLIDRRTTYCDWVYR